MSYISDILKTDAFSQISPYEKMMCENVFKYLRPAENGFLFYGRKEPRFQWEIENKIAEYVLDIEGSVIKLRRRSTMTNMIWDKLIDGSFEDLGLLIKDQFPSLYQEAGPHIVSRKIKRRI